MKGPETFRARGLQQSGNVGREGVIQETLGMMQGTLVVIEGTLVVIQGTLVVIRGETNQPQSCSSIKSTGHSGPVSFSKFQAIISRFWYDPQVEVKAVIEIKAVIEVGAVIEVFNGVIKVKAVVSSSLGHFGSLWVRSWSCSKR
jgi:hypothetical protein